MLVIRLLNTVRLVMNALLMKVVLPLKVSLKMFVM